jgi:YD repeat-containing protein
MGISRKATALALTTAMAALGSAATAQAGTFICVPPQAGVAVVSGGPNGTCDSVSTPVQLPTASADQKTLLSILPYLSFSDQGLKDSTGTGKPTITVRGANVQVTQKVPYATPDGTGNLVVGESDTIGVHSGSNNFIIGWRHTWTGSSNLVAGELNKAGGSDNVVFGSSNTVSRDRAVVSILGGSGNTASAYNSTIAGGAQRSATDFYGDQNRVIADGAPVSQSHWAKYDATGKLTASSEPLEYAYGDGRYTLSKFKGVDLAKCAVTVQSADGKRADSTWQVVSGGYIYAYGVNAAGTDWATAMPYDVVATCDK